jgi:2-dehydropantoate 2-reductase
MKIGIAGAGAMGSMFAFFFKKANIDIAVFEKDKNTVDYYKKGVLFIVDRKEEKAVFEISASPDILKDRSIIFIFVKSYDTEGAIKIIAPEINKESIIVTLQNGIGNKEIIGKYIPDKRIVYGSTSIGVTRVNSGTIRLGGMGDIVIGGEDNPVRSIEQVLELAGLKTIITDNADIAIWKKAIINAGINPLGALLEIPNGKIISNEFARRIQEQIVMEAVLIAQTIGLSFNQEEMVQQTINVCEKTSSNLCSMLQDIMAKRRTEIDSINGILIEYAKKNSISAPFNEVIYNLIKAKEIFMANQ